MTDLFEVAHKLKGEFVELDKNKDGKLVSSELAKFEIANTTLEMKRDAFRKLAAGVADGPTNSISQGDIKATISTLQARDPEERMRGVADRLEKVFGQKVAVSSQRDFNGVPSFLIDGGRNQAEAEAVIDNLVQARTNAGLKVDDIAFGSDRSGIISIYGGKVLNYAETGADVNSKLFDVIERPEVMAEFSKSFPVKEKTVSRDEQMSAFAERAKEIFGRDTTHAFVGEKAYILIDAASITDKQPVKIVDRLVDQRAASGLSRDELPLYDRISGRVAIEANQLLRMPPEKVEEIFKKIERDKEAFRAAFSKD